MKHATRKRSKLLRSNFGFQPGLALGVLGLAVLVGGVYLSAGASTVPTTDSCKPVPVVDISDVTPKPNEVLYTAASGGQGKSVRVAFKAGAACVSSMMSLVSYKTSSANGTPLNKQTIFDSKTKPLASIETDMSIDVPDCYYQIDLAYGQPLDLTTGETYHGDKTYVWGVVGGQAACSPVSNTTSSPTPGPSHSPRPSVSPSSTPVAVVSETPTPAVTPQASRTPQPGSGGAEPSPTPTVIPLGPGEATPPATTTTAIAALLPQTGRAGSLMTFLGALLITAGLFHVWMTQHHKLIKSPRSR